MPVHAVNTHGQHDQPRTITGPDGIVPQPHLASGQPASEYAQPLRVLLERFELAVEDVVVGVQRLQHLQQVGRVAAHVGQQQQQRGDAVVGQLERVALTDAQLVKVKHGIL